MRSLTIRFIYALTMVCGVHAEALMFVAYTGNSLRYSEPVDVSNHKIELGNEKFLWISYDENLTDLVKIHLMRAATPEEMKKSRLEGERTPPTATTVAYKTLLFRKSQSRFTIQIGGYRVDGYRSQSSQSLEQDNDAWMQNLREVGPGKYVATDVDGIEWVLAGQAFDMHHVTMPSADGPFLTLGRGLSPYSTDPDCEGRLSPPSH